MELEGGDERSFRGFSSTGLLKDKETGGLFALRGIINEFWLDQVYFNQ